MVIWLIVIILVGIVIVALDLFAFFYVRTLKYLHVDVVEFLKNINNRKRVNEIVLERLGQLTGLALLRIYNNLKLFPADDQETKDTLDKLKNLSVEILAVDWRKVAQKNIGDDPVILSGDMSICLSDLKTDQKKGAVAVIKEALDELKKLQKATKILLVTSFFEMSIKIKLIEE